MSQLKESHCLILFILKNDNPSNVLLPKTFSKPKIAFLYPNKVKRTTVLEFARPRPDHFLAKKTSEN